MKKNQLFAFLALLIGAVIGVIFGFLYEPRFDRYTQSKIKDKIGEIKDRISDI